MTIAAIRRLDAAAVARGHRARQDRLTKPRGSLGVLEDVSVQLAGLAGECPPPLPEPAAVAVFAGDHGVHAQGVTPWPQEVTAQMVANFLAGGAVINALAAQTGADGGGRRRRRRRRARPGRPGCSPARCGAGTRDMTDERGDDPRRGRRGDRGRHRGGRATSSPPGTRCLLTGDMGIANTTASAALIAAFTGGVPRPPSPGAGPASTTRCSPARSTSSSGALELHRPDAGRPDRRARRGRRSRARRARRVHPRRGGRAHAGRARRRDRRRGRARRRARSRRDGTAAMIAGHRSVEPGAAHRPGRARPDAARRSGPAPRRGVRRGAGAAAGAERGAGPARRRDLRRSAGVTEKERAVTGRRGPRPRRQPLGQVRASPRRCSPARAEVDYVATAAARPDDDEWAERIRGTANAGPRTGAPSRPATSPRARGTGPAVLVDSVTAWLARRWTTAVLDRRASDVARTAGRTGRSVLRGVGGHHARRGRCGQRRGRQRRRAGDTRPGVGSATHSGCSTSAWRPSADEVYLVTAGIALRLR